MNETKELDDICYIQKLLSMIFINIVPLDENNIYQIFKFLVDYLNNIVQIINAEGHKVWQNYIKQCLEILNYSNSYINIKNNNFETKNEINKNYIEKITNSYEKIILALFKLLNHFSLYHFHSQIHYFFLFFLPIIYLLKNMKY